MRMTDQYTFAPVAQRAWLTRDFRRTPPETAYEALPVCDEGSPCTDGRCPTCGAALTDTLNSFLFKVCSNEIGPWHHSAFFIETDELSHPELFRTDLAGMAASLRQAASSLAHADFVFLASIGLLHIGDPGRLVIAAEVMCSGGAWEEQVIRSTLCARFGSKCRPLMLVTEDDAAENNFVFLLENLLAPYSSREADEPTERLRSTIGYCCGVSLISTGLTPFSNG